MNIIQSELTEEKRRKKIGSTRVDMKVTSINVIIPLTFSFKAHQGPKEPRWYASA
jgi:hypothetical protein